MHNEAPHTGESSTNHVMPQQPVKSTSGLHNTENKINEKDVDGDVENQRLPELIPIKTTQSHMSRHSVIERGYSHAQSDMGRDIVGWEGEDDPEDPRNWAMKRKVSVMAWISAMCFLR